MMSSIAPAVSEIDRLLVQGKGARLYWFLEDVSLARLAATLVGMANSAGGMVLLGISPHTDHLIGISDPEAAIDRVFQAALLADPPLVLPVPQVVHAGKVPILHILVPEGLPQVYSLEGRYLWREGSQTNPIPARRLRQLLIERGIVQFESQIPPDASLDDLDPGKVTDYLQALHLPGDEAPESILLRRGCLRTATGADGDHQLLPTYSALLLFGRHPQRWLPSATILAARFTGATFSDRFIKQEISGTLPDQLRQAEAFIQDNLRTVVRLVGLAHQEIPEYPLEAIRELLVNAVAHRDYNQQGDSIHLNLFADRLEVSSPGSLPGPVTLNNLLDARFSRNAVIVQVLSDLGFVERLGYGLDRVVWVMRHNDLRAPRFEEIAGSFRVTLYGPATEADPRIDLSVYQHLELNPRQVQALNYLSSHRRISSSEYQDLCPDLHPETLRRDLVDLVRRGVLLKIGDKRATYYILK